MFRPHLHLHVHPIQNRAAYDIQIGVLRTRRNIVRAKHDPDSIA